MVIHTGTQETFLTDIEFAITAKIETAFVFTLTMQGINKKIIINNNEMKVK